MAAPKRPIKILLTGGGTGGHLFPAIAAAEALCSRMPGSEVLFIGTKRKIDQSSLARYGYTIKTIHSYGLKGKRLGELVKAMLVLPLSLLEACYQIIAFRPQVVLGVGGYVTGPVMLAAKILGKRTVIHEQNAIPGLANRQLGKFVDRICLSLPGSEKYFPAGKTVFTGNPVRQAIRELAKKSPREGKREKTLLILGGSQGAKGVNTVVMAALRLLKENNALSFSVIHQSGSVDFERVNTEYENHGMGVQVKPFFQDMARIYSEADLLVSRAGATTLAELSVLGKPAILIPYPHAADDHQAANAGYYAEGGGCIVFKESQLTAEKLSEEIAGLLSDEQRLEEMASAMSSMGRPEAAEKIVDVCLENIT